MLISVCDRMEVIDRKRTSDGFLATKGRISKVGNYTYLRHELNLDGDPNAPVSIYRPEDAVFSDESMASAAHRPLTLNHPPAFVDASNWKKYSVGHAGGKVRRDGEFLDVDMLVMDGAAISAVEHGAMLSPGYTASIKMGEGVAPNGERYDGVMEGPYHFNHIAVLTGPGRGGPECRLGDAWPTENITDSPATAEKWLRKAIALHEKHMNGDAPTTGKAGAASQELMMTQMKNALSELAGEKVKPKMKMGDTTTHTETLVKDAKKMPSLILDGLKVDLSDEEAVSAAFKKLTDAKTTAEASLATAEAAVATASTANVTAIEAKDAEIATLTATTATLTAELADARDPAKLRDAAAAYAATVAKAKALGATVADNASEADVKKAAVSLKLGDVAANWTDAQVDVSFATLTASITDTAPDAFRDAMANRTVVDFSDASAKAKTAREKMIAELSAPREIAK